MTKFLDTKTIFNYLIIVVLIIVVLLQKCGDGSGVINKGNDTTTVVEYVTVEKVITQYVPKIKNIIKRDTAFFTNTVIDTQYVISDYYSTKYYNDTIKQDSSLTLYIADSVSENAIKSRDIKYTFTYPIITNTVIKNKNEFYIGLGLTGSKTGISYFGPELLLRTKKKQVYGVGVGINGSFEPQLSLRTHWKIGLK